MPLQRIETEIARELHGFAFPMRIAGCWQTVSVFVSDDALIALGSAPEGEALRAKVEAERWAFEALASEKYEHGRATAEGILITLSDVECSCE